MPPFSVPLVSVFTFQVILVCTAFTALILLLTLQQESDFRAAVYDRLRLRDERSAEKILAQLEPVERLTFVIAQRHRMEPTNRYIGLTGNCDDVQGFMNDTLPELQQNPNILYISCAKRRVGEYYTTGDEAMDLTAVTPLSPVGNTLGTYTCATNGIANIYFLLQYPMSHSAPQLIRTDFNPYIYLKNSGLKVSQAVGWTPPGAIDGTDGSLQLSTTFAVPVEANLSSAQITLNLTWMGPVIEDVAFGPRSSSALVHTATGRLLGGRLPFSTLDLANGTSHNIRTAPDTLFRDIYAAVDARCPVATPSPCNSTAFTFSGGGHERHIVSARRVRTAHGLDMFLLQYTPEEVFFADFATRRLSSIFIGVAAALVVAVSCVAIWVAIRRPLQDLHRCMDMAADMRNAAVEEEGSTGGVLAEMQALAQTFLRMNHKLLLARPYLPQTFFVGTDDGDEATFSDRDDESEAEVRKDDEGDVPMGIIAGLRRRSSFTPTLTSSDGGGPLDTGSRTSATGSSRWSGMVNTPAPTEAPRAQLSSRKAAVLVANGRSLHRLFAALPGEAAAIQSRLTSCVLEAAAAERGVVDSFNGDHFTITFNASRLVGTPARSAAQCAVVLDGLLRQGSHRHVRGASMGVGVGRTLIGHYGTPALMKHCTVGPAYTTAAMLELCAQRHHALPQLEASARCLVPHAALADIEHSVHTAVAGWAAVENRIGGAATPVSVVIACRQAAGDEWLYELQHAAGRDPLLGVNAVLMALAHAGARPSLAPLPPVSTHALPSLDLTALADVAANILAESAAVLENNSSAGGVDLGEASASTTTGTPRHAPVPLSARSEGDVTVPATAVAGKPSLLAQAHRAALRRMEAAFATDDPVLATYLSLGPR